MACKHTHSWHASTLTHGMQAYSPMACKHTHLWHASAALTHSMRVHSPMACKRNTLPWHASTAAGAHSPMVCERSCRRCTGPPVWSLCLSSTSPLLSCSCTYPAAVPTSRQVLLEAWQLGRCCGSQPTQSNAVTVSRVKADVPSNLLSSLVLLLAGVLLSLKTANLFLAAAATRILQGRSHCC